MLLNKKKLSVVRLGVIDGVGRLVFGSIRPQRSQHSMLSSAMSASASTQAVVPSMPVPSSSSSTSSPPRPARPLPLLGVTNTHVHSGLVTSLESIPEASPALGAVADLGGLGLRRKGAAGPPNVSRHLLCDRERGWRFDSCSTTILELFAGEPLSMVASNVIENKVEGRLVLYDHP